MSILGTLELRGNTWTIREHSTGKRYTLVGVDFPARVDGQTARVIGAVEDSFGLGVLHDDATIHVQRWNVV
jgi:hypothetical protein